MALIKCPECGSEISDSASKCVKCGYPILNNNIENKRCPECGNELSENDIEVCSKCGYQFKQKDLKKSNRKIFIPIIIAIVVAVFVVVGVISLVLAKVVSTQQRIKICTELVEEDTNGKGVIKKLYYNKKSDFCVAEITVSGKDDIATINMKKKKCGRHETFELYDFTIQYAEMIGDDATDLKLAFLDYGYDPVVAYNFVANPEDFKVIYEK